MLSFDSLVGQARPPNMIPNTIPSSPDPTSRQASVVADERAMIYLIDQLILRSGLSKSEVARRLGIKLQSLNQYHRRRRPGALWLAKLAEACGGRLLLEFPK